MTNERLAADERDVNGLVLADELQHTIDERVTAEIAELAQGDIAAEVRVTIGVTAGTTERALASDLDGEQWYATGEDTTPGGKNFARREAWIGVGRCGKQGDSGDHI